MLDEYIYRVSYKVTFNNGHTYIAWRDVSAPNADAARAQIEYWVRKDDDARQCNVRWVRRMTGE